MALSESLARHSAMIEQQNQELLSADPRMLRQQAIKYAGDLAFLSVEQRLSLINLLREDDGYVDTLLGMRGHALEQQLVQGWLNTVIYTAFR